MCVCNPETMHQNTLVLEYFVPIVNPERNSKPYFQPLILLLLQTFFLDIKSFH